MKIGNSVLAAGAAVVLATSVHAAPPPLPLAPDRGAAAEAPIDPTKLALAERYLDDLDYDRAYVHVVERSVAEGLEGAYRQMETGAPVFPQTMKAEIYRSMVGSIQSYMPKVRGRLVRVLATQYTTEELTALTQFYETPVGRSIAAKSLDLTAAILRAVTDIMPKMRGDFLRRFCAHEPQCVYPPPGASD
jgi:hypothetical protein